MVYILRFIVCWRGLLGSAGDPLAGVEGSGALHLPCKNLYFPVQRVFFLGDVSPNKSIFMLAHCCSVLRVF